MLDEGTKGYDLKSDMSALLSDSRSRCPCISTHRSQEPPAALRKLLTTRKF